MKYIQFIASRIPKLYIKTPNIRIQLIQDIVKISNQEKIALTPKFGLNINTANKMIENVIGILGIPLGVGANFFINKKAAIIPMAIEEPSIIAGCSKMALFISESGGFFTKISRSFMVGQIELTSKKNNLLFNFLLNKYKKKFLYILNTYCYSMLKRGGGCFDLKSKILFDINNTSKKKIIIEIALNCCNAMGANIINTISEKFSIYIKHFFDFNSSLRILTNLSDKRIAKAKFSIPYSKFSNFHYKYNGIKIVKKIYNAFIFACKDPYRTSTHNKGILNGIDSVLLTTGNDFRAVESSVHSFAARYGNYRSLTKYQLKNKKQKFYGFITIPLSVGTIGGSIKYNPTIQTCLKVLDFFGSSAKHLSSIISSVGLAQNFAALQALALDGIQKGHMRLHSRKYLSKEFI